MSKFKIDVVLFRTDVYSQSGFFRFELGSIIWFIHSNFQHVAHDGLMCALRTLTTCRLQTVCTHFATKRWKFSIKNHQMD